jgi:hypothetical protein
MSLINFTSLNKEFTNRIVSILPKNFNLKDLKMLENGLVLMPNSLDENSGFKPLGCPKCLGVSTSQDSGGYPTLNGERLLTPEEANHSVKGVAPEILSNLWLCPNCQLPISSLLPKYDTSAL